MSKCQTCKYYDYEGDNRKGYCEWFKSYYYPNDSCDHWKAESFKDISAYILEQKKKPAYINLNIMREIQSTNQQHNQ